MATKEESSDKGQEIQNRDHLLYEIGLLSTVIVELNIARKKISLYGERHTIVTESVSRLMLSIRKLLELKQEISIGSAQTTLLFGEYALDRDNPVFRAFAEALFKKGIAAVTVAAGITADEMLRFLSFISAGGAARGEDFSQGKLFSFPHISLTWIDFGKFGFDETQESDEAESLPLWENYISAIIRGTLSSDQSETFVMTGRPADIARILNRKIERSGDHHSYDRIISAYLRDKKSDRVMKLARFGELIRGLNPDLRRQFAELSLTRYDLNEQEILQLFHSLTLDEIENIISTLQPAVLPESIRNLMSTLQKSGRGGKYFDRIREDKAVIKEFDVEIDRNILDLFQDDHFSVFVSDHYRSELHKLMEGPQRINTEVASAIAEECSESFIEKQFASLLLDLFDSPLATESDNEDLSNVVGTIVETFLETGRFADLFTLYTTIARKSETAKSEKDGGKALDRLFHSPAFIEKFITSITLWGRHDRNGVEQLARALAPSLRGPLMDALSVEDDTTTRKFLLLILKDLGPVVLDEAARRLDDTRWYVVRNMIYLIREMKGTQYSERIGTLSRSENRRVALEAIRTLLHFNAPAARASLDFLMESPDPGLSGEAIHLARAYKVREVVPKLLQMLEAKDPSGSGEDRKVEVIRALNDIGDPRAIPYLSRIAAPRRFFSRAPNERLKIAVYQGLDNYPSEAVRPLIEDGLKSGIGEIEAACRIWLKRKDRVH